MKCSKCGRELAPDEKFCGGCGTIVGGTAEVQTADTSNQAVTTSGSVTVQAENPGTESVATENVATAENAALTFGSTGTYIPAGSSGEGFSYTPPREPENKPKEPAKKRKIGGLIAILAVSVVVIAGVATAVFAKDSIMRLIKSPEDYTKYVLRNNLIGNKALSEIYNSASSGKGYNKSTVKYYMNASDDALDDLYTALEADDVDIDRDELEFAREIALTLDTQADNGKFSIGTDIVLGGKSAVTADVIYDTDGEEIYFRSKELNEDYAYYVFQGGQRNYTEQEIQQMLSLISLYNEDLPTAQDMSKYWDKYMGIAIDQIDDVDESRETMTAGDISQKMTVLEIKIDDKLSKAIAVEILGELKEDDEFKELIVKSARTYEPVLSTGVYSSYIDMDDIEDELDDWLDDAYKEAKNIKFKDKATLELYVSDRGKIQGLRFALDDDEFYSLYTQKFGKFGSELRLTEDDDEVLKVVGNGKVSFGKIVGTFDVEMPEEDVEFTLGVEGFNIKQMAAGNVSGTVTLDLGQFSKELKQLDKEENAGGVIKKLADYTLSLSISSSSKSADVKYALNKDKEEYLSAGYSVTMSNGDSISIPSGKGSVQIESEDDFIEYLKDCDFDGWADNLEDCGLPEEATDAVGEVSDLLDQYY
ncbi:MAG: zinc ribbon domain-containing protein [Lachnospiraceae bacterium]|nr:zinc ribbon domain-containing protein [Lachnospiraceae bacterium]